VGGAGAETGIAMSGGGDEEGPRRGRPDGSGGEKLGVALSLFFDVVQRTTDALRRLIVWLARLARGQVVEFVGGPARARVVVLFGCVLALNSAQIATIGAVAPQLESSLHIGNTKIGLLNSVALLVGAVTTIPVGLLVDRVSRVPMLAVSILFWSAATLAGALSGSYSTLLLTRVGLGAVAATAGPAIASLTGDYFPSRERGRVYGYILSGEIAGTALGFIVSGTAASLISWRASFVLLAIPGFFLARSLWRTLPEPLRGGHSRLERGALDLTAALADAHQARADAGGPDAPPTKDRDLARDAAARRGFEPNPELVLRTDPEKLGLVDAVRYVLRIPTNVLLIIGSSLGYYFFAGLQTFAIVFVRGHYHASEATATLVLALLVGGSLLGTLLSGPITDLMVRHGELGARTWAPAICYLGAAALLVPGILSTSLSTAIWFDVAGAGLIAAANPPLDAARLDIVPAGLWGRAESTRTFLRSLAQALAPLLFGAIADLVAGFVPQQAPVGTKIHHAISHAGTVGLEVSFLIMLSSLAAAGVFLMRARSTYGVDVATAAAAWTPAASDRSGGSPGGSGPAGGSGGPGSPGAPGVPGAPAAAGSPGAPDAAGSPGAPDAPGSPGWPAPGAA
jgi:sugar phosphate permease